MNIENNPQMMTFVKDRYKLKYDISDDDFLKLIERYYKIEPFKISESFYETEQNVELDEQLHYFVRLCTQFFITEAFKAMKIDLDDANVEEHMLSGNIGTPGRVAKMWCGGRLNDDSEHLSGRWSKLPRIASFPNVQDSHEPISKRVSLMSVCSHHIAPFSSLFNERSEVNITYIPKDKVIGISKLQRLVEAVSRRGWLQEDLTKKLYEEVSKICETDSVKVELTDIEHSCETTRGAKNSEGGFTTICQGGAFKQ